jgi:hypothetical protein
MMYMMLHPVMSQAKDRPICDVMAVGIAAVLLFSWSSMQVYVFFGPMKQLCKTRPFVKYKAFCNSIIQVVKGVVSCRFGILLFGPMRLVLPLIPP